MLLQPDKCSSLIALQNPANANQRRHLMCPSISCPSNGIFFMQIAVIKCAGGCCCTISALWTSSFSSSRQNSNRMEMSEVQFVVWPGSNTSQKSVFLLWMSGSQNICPSAAAHVACGVHGSLIWWCGGALGHLFTVRPLKSSEGSA